jgi:hypothetical protein
MKSGVHVGMSGRDMFLFDENMGSNEVHIIRWLSFYFFKSKLVLKSPNYCKKNFKWWKTENFTSVTCGKVIIIIIIIMFCYSPKHCFRLFEIPNQDKLRKISVRRSDSNPGLPNGRPRCEPDNHAHLLPMYLLLSKYVTLLFTTRRSSFLACNLHGYLSGLSTKYF